MSDDLVTDELVERAVQAYVLAPYHPGGPAPAERMRAALEAIAPAIHAAGYRAGLERAAVRAPDIIRDVLGWPENDDPDGAVKDSLNEIATAILAEKEPRHD